MILVVGGNNEQAQQWARQYRIAPLEWRYVLGWADVIGFRRPQVARVGTWGERDDLFEIDNELKAIGAIEVYACIRCGRIVEEGKYAMHMVYECLKNLSDDLRTGRVSQLPEYRIEGT